MGACLRKRTRDYDERHPSSTKENQYARRPNFIEGYETMCKCIEESSRPSYSRPYRPITIPQRTNRDSIYCELGPCTPPRVSREARQRHQRQKVDLPSSNTKVYDLPLEVMDIILQKSYLRWTLNSASKQRDEEITKSLASVDVCFYRRIIRHRFKKAIWRYLEDFYSKTRTRSAIIRNNRNYLLENIQTNEELLDSMISLNCITEEQRHVIQRQRSTQDKNAELLHFVRSFDKKRFSTFVRCLRQTNQTTVTKIIRNGGVVIKVEVKYCATTHSTFMDPQLIHQRIRDYPTRTNSRSHQTDELIRQLKDEEIEFLNTQLDRQTVVVWIWCRSRSAMENIQKLHELNLLNDVLFENIGPPTSENIEPIVINIDQNQFKKTVVVVRSISINLAERISMGRNEVVRGVTTLRNRIYFLCHSFPRVIRGFEGRNLFRLQEEIEIHEIKDPMDLGSSEKENCLYVSDQIKKCVWKITKETDYQHKIIRWLTVDYVPQTFSVSSNGHLLLATCWSSILNIYGSNAELLRSIQLPRDMENLIHAVETSIGNFYILHQLMDKEEAQESGSSGVMGEWIWVVSELTRDGQMVIRRFIPSNESKKLKNPRYMSIDSDDQVFVADTENDRVILLDSDLKWNRILCPAAAEEEEEKTRIRMPLRSCYDKRRKQLIVGGGYFYLGAFNIYIMS